MARESERKEKVNNIDDKLSMFIDREEPQKIVDAAYEEIKDNAAGGSAEDFKILNFYGLGGMGKSFLAEKIKKNLVEKQSGTQKPFIMWDADQECNLNYNRVEVLRILRNLLVKNHNFNFTEFDHYLIHFKALSGETVNLTEYAGVSNGETFLEVTKSTLDTGIQLFGIVSPLKLIETFTSNHHKRKNAKKFQRVLNDFDGISTEDRIAALTNKFIHDFNAEIKKMKEPMVIFIDTFEDFNLDSNWLFSGEEDDRFGYGLCQSLSGTLWIITGRDRIPYEPSAATKDVDYYQFYQLNKFSEGDTMYFWRTYTDDHDLSLAERIWTETEGHPLLLGIYYDLYQQQLKEHADLSLEHFFKEKAEEKTSKALVERFVRYLEKDGNTESDKSLGRLISLLACLGTWTYGEEKEWPETLTKYISNGKEDVFALIYNKSLVVTKDHVKYRLDKTVSEVLLNESHNGSLLVNDMMKKDVLNYLTEKSKGEALTDEQISQMIKLSALLEPSREDHFYNKALQSLSYTVERLLNERQLTNIIGLHIKLLDQCSEDYFHSSLGKEKVIALINLAAELNVYESAEELSRVVTGLNASPEVLESLGRFYINEGNIHVAEHHFKDGLSLMTDDDSLELYFDMIYGLYQIAYIRQNTDHMREYLTSLAELSDNINQVSYWMMFNIVLLSFYQSGRQVEKALQLIEEFEATWNSLSLNEQQDHLANFYEFERLSGLAYAQIHQFEKALSKYEHAKKGLEGSSGKESHDYLIVLDHIAEAYRLMNQHGRSAEVYKEIYETRRQVYGMNNHYTIRSVLNYVMGLHESEEYKEAIKILTDAIEGAKNVLPENHRLFGKLYNNLADAYRYSGQYEQAVIHYIHAVEQKRANPQFEAYTIIRDQIKLNETYFMLAIENRDPVAAERIFIHMHSIRADMKSAFDQYIARDEHDKIQYLESYLPRIQNLEKQIDSFLDNYGVKGVRSNDLRPTMNIVQFVLNRFPDGDRSLHAIYEIDNSQKYQAFCIDFYKEFIGFRFKDTALTAQDWNEIIIQNNTHYCENQLEYNYVEKFENFEEIINRLSMYKMYYQSNELVAGDVVDLGLRG